MDSDNYSDLMYHEKDKYEKLLKWLEEQRQYYGWFDDRTVLLQEIIMKAKEILNNK